MYFCIINNPWYDNEDPVSGMNQPQIFLLCKKEYWDKEESLDSGFRWPAAEHGFEELAECHYAHAVDSKEGKVKMLELGYTENLELGECY